MAPQAQDLSAPSLFSPVVIIAAIVVLAVAYEVYLTYVHPLSSVPGPFVAKFNRLWITKHSWDGDMNTTMIALHEKHGTLVRTGPREVSVSDLAAIKTIYGAGTKFRKSDWYSVWQGHRKFDLFAERNERIHGEQRRLVSRAYSMDSLKLLEPYVDNVVTVFLDNMQQRAGEVVDMGIWVQLFAFDVIGEVTFSKRFGFLDVGEDDGAFQQIEGALKSASWIGQVPGLYWMHDFLMPYIGNHLGVTARHGSLRQFAVKEIAARKDRGSDHHDMLSQLFATQKEKAQLDENAIISMATSNIFAGSDTTAISTRAIIYYLLKNPECKQKLLAEVDDRVRNGTLSDPVTLAEADSMPYLQAVMYEALRLHPAVGMSLPRVVPTGGVTIADTYLPAGTVVGVNPWVVHRSKEVYGEDVDAFRPERWMQENNGDMHRFFFAFGSGARMCLGKNISWMEMSKLIPTLFMHYDLDLAEPGKEWTMKCWWFVMQQGVNVRLTPRRREV